METEPLNPIGLFLVTFTLCYGMMSLVDDCCDALKSTSARNAYRDVDDFISKNYYKWTSEAEAKEEKEAA